MHVTCKFVFRQPNSTEVEEISSRREVLPAWLLSLRFLGAGVETSPESSSFINITVKVLGWLVNFEM